MGSLNGDVVVMRNGRSTSQVSIYNYPEHLNPFYEDDQHKRLRFWKISKKDNEGRRNSFSIGNLKDMWAFKSFRLKKKSSTLGITKTSESPPPLRREYVVDNGWNSFDHRLRDSRTSSINGDNFQRNATYRSSLQNLPSNNVDRIGFNRNDDYRSTIQVPRPNPRYHQPQKPQTQPRRSSQSSMASTNPFESDIEDDNEDVNGMRSVIGGGSTSTLSKVTPRKKRRAPAPPTPTLGSSNRAVTPTIVIESSQSDAQNDLCIREDTDIANLTAEIENFVKNKSNEDVETSVVITENKTANVTNTEAAVTTTNHVNAQENVETTTVVITSTTTVPAPAPEIETTTASSPVDAHAKEQIEVKNSIASEAQTNGPTKAELITEKTVTNGSSTVVNHQVTPVAAAESPKSNIVTKNENIKEVQTNGAIPKKSHAAEAPNSPNRVANIDLCIEESSERQQRPIPVQRTSKQDTEVGHVECIHVHVESPRATPRQEHANGVSSFKKETKVETTEIITTKTPFILTSPPRQRKSIQQTEVANETARFTAEQKPSIAPGSTINEQQQPQSPTQPKPEIIAKPAISPKPLIERNGKVHTFAEIHKPMRTKVTHTANGHVRRASREDTVAAPTVPQQQAHERHVEGTLTVAPVPAANIEIESKKTETQVAPPDPEVPKTELKIEENPPAAKNERSEISSTTSQSPPSAVETTVEADVVSRRETNENSQFESLYRPQSHMEWKRSTLAPLETNIPPEKRKSVKDIIESINRSQRLLHAAANKDFTIVTGHPASTAQNTDDYDENLRILDQSQREVRRMVQQIDNFDNINDANRSRSPSTDPPSYSECVGAQKLDNSEVFQKCKVNKEVYDYRETSPISSNLDWNPVPKPKRTKPQHE